MLNTPAAILFKNTIAANLDCYLLPSLFLLLMMEICEPAFKIGYGQTAQLVASRGIVT